MPYIELTDRKAEQRILGGALTQTTLADTMVSRLEEADFTEARHVVLFRTLHALLERRETADVLSVTQELGEDLEREIGFGYVAETAALGRLNDPEPLLKLLIELRLRRELQALGQYLLESVHDSQLDPQSIREKVDRAIAHVWQAECREQVHPIDHVIPPTVLKFCDSYNTKRTSGRRSTGIEPLDQLVLGWPERGLVLITPSDEVDPYALTAALVSALLETGGQTLLVSEPLMKEEMVLRLLCHRCNIPWRNALSGTFDQPALKSLMASATKLSKMPLTLFDANQPIELLSRIGAEGLPGDGTVVFAIGRPVTALELQRIQRVVWSTAIVCAPVQQPIGFKVEVATHLQVERTEFGELRFDIVRDRKGLRGSVVWNPRASKDIP